MTEEFQIHIDTFPPRREANLLPQNRVWKKKSSNSWYGASPSLSYENLKLMYIEPELSSK